jgi:AbrB family looped-hinge helix DNA binding protein
MQTRVSSKGQVVLPSPLRRKMGLAAGDTLDVNLERGRIVLTPRRAKRNKAKIVIDPVTGFPALTAGPNAPKLTSAEVEEMLSDFP